ncbi:MAG: YmdB family metallophosphoesterase [Acholeplasmatales bacterium]|jgi:metallophosphoesterase (TIGR00282 family)|nr:YmdB family metallophosphoesterase [Acholeplasmatales bacterium]
MRILAIGDVVGKEGREFLYKQIPYLKATYNYNLLVVNAENIGNLGRGITLKIYKELMSNGVHILTMGNWTWGEQELFSFIDNSNVIRPINFNGVPGSGYKIINYNNQKVMFINVLGKTFMEPNLDNGFILTKQLIEKEKADYIVVDIHAEATSEKIALAYYLDGKVNAVFGTHTHVQTADERVLDNGTLFITDIGMTGSSNGIIGVSKEVVLARFLNGLAVPKVLATGKCQLNAVLLDLDNKTIERINYYE